MKTFREAIESDIDQMTEVRLSVKENRLSDPNSITRADYKEYLFKRGKGWVCEIDNIIRGFSIADVEDHNIWALFVHPRYEKMGIGKSLHRMMLEWYFNTTVEKVWLSTAPGSRAETFYRKAGWIQVGQTVTGEIKFEMTLELWKKNTNG